MAKGKYDTHVKPYLTLIAAWYRDGATDEDIWTKLGISKSAFYDYKIKHKEFSDSLKIDKELADVKVENALFKRSTGFSRFISKPIKLREVIYENGKKVKETERIEMAHEEIYYPPDTTADIYWTSNRMPHKWRRNPVVTPDTSDKLGKLIDAMTNVAESVIEDEV